MPSTPEEKARARAAFEDALEQLEPLGDVTGKAMFGGYGFWERGDMFALVSSSGTLYLKADETTVPAFRKARATQFAPEMSSGEVTAMPYWSVPAAVRKDDARFAEWANRAIAVGHATAKKKPAKKKAAKQQPAARARAGTNPLARRSY